MPSATSSDREARGADHRRTRDPHRDRRDQRATHGGEQHDLALPDVGPVHRDVRRALDVRREPDRRPLAGRADAGASRPERDARGTPRTGASWDERSDGSSEAIGSHPLTAGAYRPQGRRRGRASMTVDMASRSRDRCVRRSLGVVRELCIEIYYKVPEEMVAARQASAREGGVAARTPGPRPADPQPGAGRRRRVPVLPGHRATR